MSEIHEDMAFIVKFIQDNAAKEVFVDHDECLAADRVAEWLRNNRLDS